MSKLSQYKAFQLAQFSQLILLDDVGLMVSSCDSLFSTQVVQEKNVLKWFPFVESIFETLRSLQIDQPAIRFAKIETNLPFLPGVYDFSFERVSMEETTYLLWSIYDYTELYEGVRNYQQRRNELEIQRHLLEAQNKQLRHQKDILLRKNRLLEDINQAHLDYHQKIRQALESPLNAIDGLTQRLLYPSAGQGEDYLSRLKTSLNQLRAITEDLDRMTDLLMPNTRSGDFELPQAIDQVLALLNTQTDGHLALHYEIGPNVPHHLHGEVLSLQQICYSLLMNAYQHQPNTQIELKISLHTLHQKACRLAITINEQGPGPVSLSTDAPLSTDFSALVFRLSIVRKLIEWQNGQIEVVPGPSSSGLSISCQLPYQLARKSSE